MCGCLLHTPRLGTWPATQASALTRNWTGDLSLCVMTLNPLGHTSRGNFPDYLNWELEDIENINFFIELLLEKVYILIGCMNFVFKISAKAGFCLSDGGAECRAGRLCEPSPLSCSYCHPGWACRTHSECVLTVKEGWGGQTDWPSEDGVHLLLYLWGVTGTLPEIRTRAWRSCSHKPQTFPFRPWHSFEGDWPWREEPGCSLASGCVTTLLEHPRICHSLEVPLGLELRQLLKQRMEGVGR